MAAPGALRLFDHIMKVLTGAQLDRYVLTRHLSTSDRRLHFKLEEREEPLGVVHKEQGLWGVECILAVIGTGGPVKRSNIYLLIITVPPESSRLLPPPSSTRARHGHMASVLTANSAVFVSSPFVATHRRPKRVPKMKAVRRAGTGSGGSNERDGGSE
eukprot:1196208-Prorocentrum_minimum.AAC.3